MSGPNTLPFSQRQKSQDVLSTSLLDMIPSAMSMSTSSHSFEETGLNVQQAKLVPRPVEAEVESSTWRSESITDNNNSKKSTIKPRVEPPPWNISTKAEPEISVSAKLNSRPDSAANLNLGQKRPQESNAGVEKFLQFESTSPRDQISSRPEEEEEEEFEDEKYTSPIPGHYKYPVTPHQLRVFNIFRPTQEDLESSPAVSQLTTAEKAQHFFIQAYELGKRINLEVLSLIVNKVCSEYKVLCTQFWRNEKILDADVIGLFGKQPWTSIPLSKFLTTVYTDHLPRGGSGGDIISFVARDWIQKAEQMDSVFRILALTETAAPPNYKQKLIVLASTSVADEISCSFIMKQVFELYSECLCAGFSLNSQDRQLLQHIDGYVSKEEADDFIDFAYALKPSKKAYIHWKDTCIETVQDSIEGTERENIETQLRRLTIEVDAQRTQVASLTRRKAELELEEAEMKQHRVQIDLDSHGPVESYMDPVTCEVIEISKSAKAAIIRVVLGNEAVEDNVSALLAKHDISADVQRKLGTLNMTLETFSAISEDELVIMGLLTKDRRKIMALSEYVRNRVKESLQEQTKVKYALERKIQKIHRDLDSISTQLKNAQHSLDTDDDMCIRLKHILWPPTMETKLFPISITADSVTATATEPNSSESTSSHSSASIRFSNSSSEDLEDIWGFVPFEVNSDLVSNLRQFKESCKMSLKNQKKSHTRKASSSSGFESETSSADEMSRTSATGDKDQVDEDKQPYRPRPISSEAVCLAAFAVLLKHVSGQEKFLVGYRADYRRSGVLVGPLTDLVPVKVDLSIKGVTFNAIVNTLARGIRDAQKQALNEPYAAVADRHQLPARFPVEFYYLNQKETETWLRMGMSMKDVISMAAQTNSIEESEAALSVKRLFSVNEPSGVDIRLILAEEEDSIVGGIQFRRSKFDEEKVSKWASKYLTTLDGVEYGARKLVISNMISRYYSSVFLNKTESSASLSLLS